jgi:hypothetical protein
MEEPEDFLPKFLYHGGPFLPRLTLAFRLKVMISVARGDSLPLTAILNLRELYLSHFQKLLYNSIIPRDFEMPREGLDHYKLGFLTPIVIIQSSIQKRRSIVYSYATDFSFTNDLVGFILDKTVACNNLRKNKAPWMEVFQLAKGYEDCPLYIVGVATLEQSFLSVLGANSS